VPAATLLIPYFEVDLNDPNGATTLLAIQNASASALLAHVQLWTDMGIPTLNYSVYLTGFDVQTINMRDLFEGRFAPVTASDGQDPPDTISPQGPISQDINFASCSGAFPYPVPLLGPATLADLVRAHTGQPIQSSSFFMSPAGTCWASPRTDNVVRGYITVNSAVQCTYVKPTLPAYFDPLDFNNLSFDFRNIMLGDYFLVNPGANTLSAESAIHIEARYPSPGAVTFYSSLTGSTVDGRESLPTAWVAPYLDQRSDYIVWREPGSLRAPFTCGAPPAPLSHRQVFAFDTEENPGAPVGGTPFGLVSARISVGPGSLAPAHKAGFAFLNLNSSTNQIRQSWVTVISRPESNGPAIVDTGASGIALGYAAAAANPVLP
jgi:hypothetical protein